MTRLQIKWFIIRTIKSLKDKAGMTRNELNDAVFEELLKHFPLTEDEDSDSWFQYICELTEKLELQIS